MQKILFLQPVFHERIWGGKKLNEEFNYIIPNDKTGECWAISAHKNGDCLVTNGALKGKSLSQVYNDHRELFNHCTQPVFPLLTKIIDAQDDLSVQVHPNDSYALKHEQDLGKTECWYIIDCDSDAEMVFGHHAKTKAELIQYIQENKWDQLLNRIPIKPGDFFYVPAGTIHALCKGTLVLETQQSSDTTYRVFDYHRKDASGNTRPLHISKAIEVTTVPHEPTDYKKEVKTIDGVGVTTYIKSEFFTVEKWDIHTPFKLKNEQKFLLVSVLKGEGSMLNENVKKGDHFIITSMSKDIIGQGNLELLVSYL